MRQKLSGSSKAARFDSPSTSLPYVAAVAKLRDALGDEFTTAWAEGEALSLKEAISYAQRGHGERKRPSTGWASSLTPTELDVVRLVAEGLGNKDVAVRLFISHRTVQTHLRAYAKLGMRVSRWPRRPSGTADQACQTRCV